ncbi:mCG1027983, partial [Mus musculus]
GEQRANSLAPEFSFLLFTTQSQGLPKSLPLVTHTAPPFCGSPHIHTARTQASARATLFLFLADVSHGLFFTQKFPQKHSLVIFPKSQ